VLSSAGALAFALAEASAAENDGTRVVVAMQSAVATLRRKQSKRTQYDSDYNGKRTTAFP
jgi:hypothetical protein